MYYNSTRLLIEYRVNCSIFEQGQITCTQPPQFEEPPNFNCLRLNSTTVLYLLTHILVHTFNHVH